MENWWHEDKESVAGKLVSNIEQGLTSPEVKERQARYGPNQLVEKPG